MELQGLSEKEVAQKKSQGLLNVGSEVKTKTAGQVIAGHTLTLFNALNLALALALLLVGSYKNMLFMGVVICNTAIGVFQELRSKRMVDKLSILVSHKAHVIRAGKQQEIPIEEIVLGDFLHLSRGNQIPADCVVLQGRCYMNESLITGESDLITKEEGDQLLSGSFVAAGDCIAQVIHVGKENYAAQISNEAKELKQVHSEIMMTLKKLIRVISCVIIPMGAFLFYNQFTIPGASMQAAVVNTVAALIGMIPEGLMLLTSTVLAVSVIRLSKSKVLVQQLYCIETLARVDVLCLDKTGTITCDDMEVEEMRALPEVSETELRQAFAAFTASSKDQSATIAALQAYFTESVPWKARQVVHFSSEKKWSGVSYDTGLTYVVGAGEFILGERYHRLKAAIAQQAGTRRVLMMAKSRQGFGKEETLPEGLEPMGYVLIQDKIRPEAPKTIEYFCEQGVRLKVISGDSTETVQQIAQEAGIPDADQAVDARTLESDAQLEKAAEQYQVFGRVTPLQKKKLVQALQKQGHTVAMTGDGVNDVLALKEADCSVAMAAGSDAARNIAQLVLTTNDFSSMPKVVAEGRRSINNIQRSASLFLVKTLFSICIGILFVFLDFRYPFQPIQMSFIGVFTIGLPSFILALEPNKERIKGNFFYNIMTRAMAGAVTMTIGIIVTYLARTVFKLSYEETSTLAVILTATSGVYLLIRISIPFNLIRKILLGVVLCGLLFGIFCLQPLLGLASLSGQLSLFILGTGILNAVIFTGLYHLTEHIRIKKERSSR